MCGPTPTSAPSAAAPWVWQGLKPTQLHSEIFDMRHFMPIASVGDFDRYTLPNGYGVEVVKPLEELRITYEDATRGNAFDVTLTAFMPPAMLATGLHFEQGMRTRGSVTLLGQQHVVDGFTLRDRSWGEARPEGPRAAPIVHWLAPVFDEDFAIHVCAMEDPTRNPIWHGVLDYTPEQAAAPSRGWVWRNGEIVHLETISLTADWDRVERCPASYRIDAVDVTGRSWSLTAERVAAANWYPWNNMYAPILLMRYECNGRIGYGDAHIGAFADVVRQCL